ncbi:hypothetical protein HAX54_014551, partial [Datura stramonium]|nr:hypothetical protein [Datura stramonium]
SKSGPLPSDIVLNSRKDSHYMVIITRSGRKLYETTPIGAEQVEELASETELIVEDEVERLNLAKHVEREVTENSQGDKGKAKGKE